MGGDWKPAEAEKELRTRAAHDGERLHFEFRWDQSNPGGWIHDMLVYHEGRWQRFADPSPWVSGEQTRTGFYEDRLSFFLDDGSVRGFEEFAGWLTAHEGMRSLPSAASADDVEAHPHYGERLGKSDIRKFLPQACAGEWWEGHWREVRPPAELRAMKARGEFLDLAMWRAHRSDPVGYGTDAYVLDYRHADDGRRTYTSQNWAADTGPELMFAPDVVEGGALDYHAVAAGEFPTQGSGVYALTPDVTVPFDPDVAEWEGAMIPRRPVHEPTGSAADWTASGTWTGQEWVVTMSRPLSTVDSSDTTQLVPGGTYLWAPAVHHGAGKRWHWTGYTHRLGIGVAPEWTADLPPPLIAHEVDHAPTAASVDWGALPTHTTPLVFPGLQSWTDLVDGPNAEVIRNLETTMWALHGRTSD
ncbi:ethylbenzene dehydrogenase-related protein [Salinigranum halophilum]|uniref:ethylbenzene dehydrogenase-related protein n=1 Tax=Salinigranum halophilum TaxID=2565931 RepID=UPI0010A929E3|nr:ethylbenzene dehydrogenase-related protein [Salinigranum halophilum]